MINKIIFRIKNYGFLSIPSAILKKIKLFLYRPKVILEKVSIKPVTLGSQYGGKRFFDFQELNNSRILSCGLGEDASFDIEFAKKYNSQIILVDPTPSAITHYNYILESIKNREENSNNNSTENAGLYDLSNVNESQLLLEKFALWTTATKLKFFAPKNPEHVSYSITNFQHNYSLSEKFKHIIVDSVTLQALLEKYKLEQLHLLKLDIEGAEVEVLKDMMKNKIYPTQIIVEFDGFNSPSKRALSDYYEVDSQLRSNGYLCYDFDGLADFLYVQSNRVKEELNNV